MESEPLVTNVPDRVRLPLRFDTERLSEEVRSMGLQDFTYYDVVPLRSPAHLLDSSIGPPPPADDYADGTWTEWLDTPALQASPCLREVVDTFRARTRVTLVRLLRLEAGSIVKEHTDPTLGLHIHKSVIRLTIPIISDDTVEFYLNGSVVPMKPGECWYLRFTDPHKVVNAGPAERINMSIDMAPNEWVRSLIESGLSAG